jgi:predicted PurR-regulated permease PerM
MLNLLPWRAEKIKWERNLALLILLNLILVMTIIFLGTVYSTKKIFSQKKSLANQFQKIIIRENNEINEIRSVLKNVTLTECDTSEFFVRTVRVIIKLLPIGCFLTSLLLDRDGLLLEGVMLVPSKEIFMDFIKRMGNSLPNNIKILSLKYSDQNLQYGVFISIL